MATQPPTRPLIAELEQLRRSVDSMNSQAAEMLKILENLRNVGADHIATPSSEQEKLDREWEYFETVCDQIFFILDNAKYKLKRRQNDLAQQLNPPTPLPSPPPQEQPLPIVIDSPGTSATSLTAAITIATTAEASSVSVSDAVSAPNPLPTATPDTIPTNHMPSIPASSSMSEPQDDLSMPSFDLQMLSPPSQFDNMNTGMSTEAIAPAADMNMMDDSLMSEENKLQDTMLDLGDIGNLGDNLGDMDDMINF